MPGKARKKIIFILFALLIVSVDFLSKRFVFNSFSLGQSIPVIKNVFHISLVANKGSAFGLFKNLSLFFSGFSILAIIVIIYLFFTLRNLANIDYFSLSLILAGACGNLIDRLSFGFVIDFLDFRIWPVFNLADSAITVGVGLLIFQLLFKKEKSIMTKSK